MLPYQTISRQDDKIVIVGIGGAGANILQCFGGSSADNVRLCSMSLDERVGRASGNVEFLQLGEGMNHGLGSGGDPQVGKQAAEGSAGDISRLIKGARLVVMVAGLGGGTGSGAAPVLAHMAKEAGVFLVTVAVMPFAFEGRRRRQQADAALEEISRLSDIVYCFENDYMEEMFRSRPGARAVFEEVNRLLAKATASVPMLSSSPGLINLGLDELATALENSDSRCIFGSGTGHGAHRAEDAARAALESPLMSFNNAIGHARCVIAHVAGGDSMSLAEVRTTMETVREALADEDVTLFFGTSVKSYLGDEMRLTLIASIDGVAFAQSLAAKAAEEAAARQAEQARQARPSQPETAERPEDAEVEDAADDARLAAGDDAAAGGAVSPEEAELPAGDEADEQPEASSQSLLEPEEPEYTVESASGGTASEWDAYDGVAEDAFPASAAHDRAAAQVFGGELPPMTEDESLFDVDDPAPRYSREASGRSERVTESEPAETPLPAAPLSRYPGASTGTVQTGSTSGLRVTVTSGASVSRAPRQSTFDLGFNDAAPGTPRFDDEVPPPTLAKDFFARAGHDASAGPEGGHGLMHGTPRRSRLDDLDTPPSLRFNDFRDMFPDK